jgi:hypothetical protein
MRCCLNRPDSDALIDRVFMRTKRRNAVTDFEAAAGSSVAYLASLGFTRSGHLFHRRSNPREMADKIEGIALCFAYGFRTCWLHATVKFPGLVGLLGPRAGLGCAGTGAPPHHGGRGSGIRPAWL